MTSRWTARAARRAWAAGTARTAWAAGTARTAVWMPVRDSGRPAARGVGPLRILAAASVAITALAALGGCASSGSGAATSSSPTATSAAAAVTSAPGAAPVASSSATSTVEPAPTATAAISAPAGGFSPATSANAIAAAVVKGIRVADHGTFDRVVVEFTGSFGSWTAGYVDKVINDPEGGAVPLKGKAYLVVRVQKATFDNLFQVGGGITHLAYAGPHRVAPALANVQEIADAGDFEAVIGLGIGVDHVAGLRAYRMDDPTRLVIDVAH